MDLSFYALTLEAIDQAAGDALCLFVGEDERPLTGLAGLADWRLQGGLSRYLRSGLLTGTAGEALLTLGSRLGFRRLFLFGIGPRSQSEEELCDRVGEALRKLAQAGVEEAALQLPSKLPLDVGVRTLIDEPGAPARAMVFGPDPAALVRALSHAASRPGAEARHDRRVVKVPGPPKLQGPPVRQQPQARPPLEIPKASPLSFAPQGKADGNADADAAANANANANAKPISPAPAITLPEPRPAPPPAQISEPPVAPLAETTPPPPIAALSAPPAPQLTPTPPLAEPTPIPPLADLTPAPAAPVATQPPAAQGVPAVPDPAPKPQGTLPVTHKPERFVPPPPRVVGKGKKKRR